MRIAVLLHERNGETKPILVKTNAINVDQLPPIDAFSLDILNCLGIESSHHIDKIDGENYADASESFSWVDVIDISQAQAVLVRI